MIDFKDVHRQGAIEKGKAMGEYGVGESWEVLAVSVSSTCHMVDLIVIATWNRSPHPFLGSKFPRN